MPAIRLTHYTQAFGTRTVFRDVSSVLEWSQDKAPGIIGLMGPSGSGKTSLLRQIMNGRYIAPVPNLALSPADIVIGFVPQSPVLFQNMDVAANARMFAFMGRYQARFDQKLFSQLVTALRLEAVLRDAGNPQRLSGGEMQRLMLLRTLSIKPDLLLLDEPATGLDAAVRDTFLVDLCDIVERLGVATLYIGHHWEEVSFVSDQIAYLVTGDNEANGPTVSAMPIASRADFVMQPPTIDAFQAVYGPGCGVWPAIQVQNKFFLAPVPDINMSGPKFIACLPGRKTGRQRFSRSGPYRLSIPDEPTLSPSSEIADAWIYCQGSFLCRAAIDNFRLIANKNGGPAEDIRTDAI
jgi:ABC-type multidrug transport system ATPase subunit